MWGDIKMIVDDLMIRRVFATHIQTHLCVYTYPYYAHLAKKLFFKAPDAV